MNKINASYVLINCMEKFPGTIGFHCCIILFEQYGELLEILRKTQVCSNTDSLGSRKKNRRSLVVVICWLPLWSMFKRFALKLLQFWFFIEKLQVWVVEWKSTKSLAGFYISVTFVSIRFHWLLRACWCHFFFFYFNKIH